MIQLQLTSILAWLAIPLAMGSGGQSVEVAAASREAAQAEKVTVEQQQAIDVYVSELARVNASTDISLERLLAAAYRVQAILMPAADPDARPRPTVEDLPPGELERVRRQLTGIRVHIGDTIHVTPDPGVLLALARAKGRPVDVEFFALLDRAYDPSSWPIWIQRTGPESGCVDFTSGELVDMYWAWRRFEAAYPGSYAFAVDRELRSMEHDLLAAGSRLCAQDMRLVERELDRLITVLPKDPLAPKIRGALSRMRR